MLNILGISGIFCTFEDDACPFTNVLETIQTNEAWINTSTNSLDTIPVDNTLNQGRPRRLLIYRWPAHCLKHVVLSYLYFQEICLIFASFCSNIAWEDHIMPKILFTFFASETASFPPVFDISKRHIGHRCSSPKMSRLQYWKLDGYLRIKS